MNSPDPVWGRGWKPKCLVKLGGKKNAHETYGQSRMNSACVLVSVAFCSLYISFFGALAELPKFLWKTWVLWCSSEFWPENWSRSDCEFNMLYIKIIRCEENSRVDDFGDLVDKANEWLFISSVWQLWNPSWEAPRGLHFGGKQQVICWVNSKEQD